MIYNRVIVKLTSNIILYIIMDIARKRLVIIKKRCLYCNKNSNHSKCFTCCNFVCTKCYNFMTIPACNICNNWIIPNKQFIDMEHLPQKYLQMITQEAQDYRDHTQLYKRGMSELLNYCLKLFEYINSIKDETIKLIDGSIDDIIINGKNFIVHKLTFIKYKINQMQNLKYNSNNITDVLYELRYYYNMTHRFVNKKLAILIYRICKILHILHMIIENIEIPKYRALKISHSAKETIDIIKSISDVKYINVYDGEHDELNIISILGIKIYQNPIGRRNNWDTKNLEREENKHLTELYPEGYLCNCSGRILQYKSYTKLYCVFCEEMFDIISGKYCNSNAFTFCWQPYGIKYGYNKPIMIDKEIIIDQLYLI